MSERNFHLRSRVTYAQPDNKVDTLEVEIEADGQWRPFVLNEVTPGFEVFVYSMLSCQHTYFRLNCAENDLLLERAEGDILMGADIDWNLELIQVEIRASLVRGQVNADLVDYIVGRMGQCPVSRNTKDAAVTRIDVNFDL